MEELIQGENEDSQWFTGRDGSAAGKRNNSHRDLKRSRRRRRCERVSMSLDASIRREVIAE